MISRKYWAKYFKLIKTPETDSSVKYPDLLQNGYSKGRFFNIVTLADEMFPLYNANRYYPSPSKLHVLLEGPSQRDADHCKRFLDCLLHQEVAITDIIVAGHPNDGREYNRGFLNYFNETTHSLDNTILMELSQHFVIKTKTLDTKTQIHHHQLTLSRKEKDAEDRLFNVYHLSSFADFGVQVFSLEEIQKLLTIYQTSSKLAIHCSAGMGRSGVIGLAYTLFADYNNFFNQDLPLFDCIQACLEKMRVLRPMLVQSHTQLRMAINLTQFLYLAETKQLTEERLVQVEKNTDQALHQYYLQKKVGKVLTDNPYTLHFNQAHHDEDQDHQPINQLQP